MTECTNRKSNIIYSIMEIKFYGYIKLEEMLEYFKCSL